MKYMNLDPREGWETFARNSELADLIYDTFFDRVNDGGWAYINPMSGMGIFEDESGNYLCLETQDVKETNLIREMHFGLNETINSDMHSFIKQWETDFGLVRTVRR